MYLSYDEIQKTFTAPGAKVPGSKAWHDAQAVLARRREKRARGNELGQQRLLAWIAVGSALEAILATLYIDKLRGIETKLCALKGCNKLFDVESGHGKMYCSNYHAHLASIRKKRAAAKSNKLRGRKGKSK
jgi:hypothetical protein